MLEAEMEHNSDILYVRYYNGRHRIVEFTFTPNGAMHTELDVMDSAPSFMYYNDAINIYHQWQAGKLED